MAGEERIIPESGLLMIHNAWTEVSGDPNQLRKAAEDLDMITKPSVNIYVNKTGLSEEEVKEMMDNETWMDYQMAFSKGFATSIQRNDNIHQSVKDINSYIRNLVKQNAELKEQIKNNQIETKVEKGSWESFFNTKK